MAETSKKLNISLASVAMEKLEEMKKRKGLTRSAVVALAIEKLWKEEYETK